MNVRWGERRREAILASPGKKTGSLSINTKEKKLLLTRKKKKAPPDSHSLILITLDRGR